MIGEKLRVYLTHCSAKKDDALKNTSKKVTPDKFYTASPTRRFMNKCKEKSVDWAIFSDLYGVWFPILNMNGITRTPTIYHASLGIVTSAGLKD